MIASKWYSISCRWRHWYRIIAWYISHFSKSITIAHFRSGISAVIYVMLGLHLRKPILEWQILIGGRVGEI